MMVLPEADRESINCQALLARLILTGGGLVQQQNRGVHSTDAGQCHHLFCAAAETHRLCLGNGGQAELGQDLLGPGLDLILRQFQVLETVLDLIPHGGAEDLIVGVLEYIAHGFGKVAGADLAQYPVPQTFTVPEVGRSRPLKCLESVVLPLPFWPMMATISPLRKERLMSLRASTPPG